MSKQRLTPREIPTLKRLAKTIKRDQKISHSEALNQIAFQYGYSAWSQLHSEAIDTQRVEQLLREFADGKREQCHLNFVLRLWEHQASLPEVRPVVSKMLSQLTADDELTITALLAEHSNGDSPEDLLAAIEMARSEKDAGFDKAELLASEIFEQEIDKVTDDQESVAELDELLAPLPISTQNMILSYRFGEIRDARASTLAEDVELYKRNRDNVNKALLLVAELYAFGAFSDSQALNQWLKSPCLNDSSSRCPLDALWNNGVLVFVEQYAEKAHEMFQRCMIQDWRSNPDKVPSEVRHLLDDKDIALRNFSTIERAIFADAIPEMASKLEYAMKPIK
tara:strand:+ start:27865 stop:28878 length:1014 start_codon:yes stop_codon:yes gene_type:complete